MKQVAALFFLVAVAVAMPNHGPHDHHDHKTLGHVDHGYGEMGNRLLNGLADIEEWTQMINNIQSTNECIKRQITGFGAIDWEDRISYYENGTIQRAPLSLACFIQCWYEIDDQSDKTTGLPSSAATIASEGDHQDRHRWVKQLAHALTHCENEVDLMTPHIDDDSLPTTPAGLNENEKCVKSLKIDSCVNQHLKAPCTDKDSYHPITKTHDMMAAVERFVQGEEEETEGEHDSKFVDPLTD